MGLVEERSSFITPTVDAEHMPAERQAVILVGHGSLRSGAGAAMIRLAERVHRAGVAPIVEAGFLNYRRPTFAEAVERCIGAGARAIVVQPYFLVPGKFVREDLQHLVASTRSAHPGLALHVAQPFGDHPALARLVLNRALEADYLAANPQLAQPGVARALEEGASWRPLHRRQRTGLLIMAHGSPDPRANRPIYALAQRIRAYGHYAAVVVCFMDLNRPSIAGAIDALSARGISNLIVVPYFLHLGNHVVDDLPAIIADARARHPASTILLAGHLAYDRLLVTAIADRVAEALASADQPTSGMGAPRNGTTADARAGDEKIS
jgi:sirohydrochlorin cobaltochelatase